MVEQYFEDALERKNQVIQRLLGDLDENEEQYSTMLHTHIENIETMIGMWYLYMLTNLERYIMGKIYLFYSGLHASRIDFWKTSYKEEKRSLLNQYHAEMQRYRDRKFKSFRELECVYYGLESKVDRERNEAVEHHLRKCDNVKSGVSIYRVHNS